MHHGMQYIIIRHKASYATKHDTPYMIRHTSRYPTPTPISHVHSNPSRAHGKGVGNEQTMCCRCSTGARHVCIRIPCL